jgi:hypothetical protein
VPEYKEYARIQNPCGKYGHAGWVCVVVAPEIFYLNFFAKHF